MSSVNSGLAVAKSLFYNATKTYLSLIMTNSPLTPPSRPLAAQIGHSCQKLIFWLLNLLMLVGPFVFVWVNEELFEFNKMLLVYIVTGLTTSLGLIRCLIQEKNLFTKQFLTWPWLMFLASQILATIFSLHPRTSFFGYYTRFHGGLLSTICYWLLFLVASHHLSITQIKKLFQTGLLAVCLVSVLAIGEHFGHSFSCLIIRGQFDTECWVQDVQNRVFATFGQPNWLAAYLITLWPLFLSWLLTADPKSRPNWRTISCGLGLFLAYLAILFTKSKSGWLGWLLGWLIFWAGWGKIQLEKSSLFFRGKKFELKFKTYSSWVAISSWLAIIILTATVGTPISQPLTKILSLTQPSISSSPDPAPTDQQLPSAPPVTYEGTDSGTIRQIVWKGAIAIWRRYPIFGSGVETFAYSYDLDRPPAHNLVSEWDFLYNKAHNEFLNLLATTGLVGLISYLIWQGTIFWLAGRIYWSSSAPTEHRLTALSLAAGLLSLHLSNFFGFSTVMVSVLMSLIAAYLSLLSTKIKQPAADNNQLEAKLINWPVFTFNKLLGLILLVIINSQLISLVIKTWRADYLFASGKAYLQANQFQIGLTKIETAVKLSPNEPTFRDELAESYALVASELTEINQATPAAEYANLAIAQSDRTLRLNPYAVNYYKTRARIFSYLATLNPEHLNTARDTLQAGQILAPQDAKIDYQLGLIALSQNQPATAIADFNQAITKKSNYLAARQQLAQIYEQQANWPAALEQYQYIITKLVPSDQQAAEKIKILQASIAAQVKAQ